MLVAQINMTVNEAKKVLDSNGFIIKSQKGSHVKFVKGNKTIIIACHGRKSERLHPRSVKEIMKNTK